MFLPFLSHFCTMSLAFEGNAVYKALTLVQRFILVLQSLRHGDTCLFLNPLNSILCFLPYLRKIFTSSCEAVPFEICGCETYPKSCIFVNDL